MIWILKHYIFSIISKLNPIFLVVLFSCFRSLATDLTEKLETVKIGLVGNIRITVPYIPDLVVGGHEALLKRDKQNNSRIYLPIEHPSYYPYSTIGKIISCVDPSLSGTGFLIGPCHAIISKNVLKRTNSFKNLLFCSNARGKYFQENPIQVISINEIENKYNHIGDEDRLIVLTLEKPLGLITGWLGLAQPPKLVLRSRNCELVGYPVNHNENMYTSYGKIETFCRDYFTYSMDTLPGHGGSPILTSLEGGRGVYAVGVHISGSPGFNSGLRFNKTIFENTYEVLKKEINIKVSSLVSFLPPLVSYKEYHDLSTFKKISKKRKPRLSSSPTSVNSASAPARHVFPEYNHTFKKGFFPYEDLSWDEEHFYLRSQAYDLDNKFLRKKDFWESLREKHAGSNLDAAEINHLSIPNKFNFNNKIGLLKTTFLIRREGKDNVKIKVKSTGFLIGPRHILTCAHNLYDNGLRGIDPMQHAVSGSFSLLNPQDGNNQNRKFNIIAAYIPPLWITSNPIQSENDYGLAILEEDIGYTTGWLGLISLPDFLLEEQEIYLVRLGYPFPLSNMSFKFGLHKGLINQKLIFKDRMTYKAHTYQGCSGSPLTIISDEMEGAYCIGIHSNSKGSEERATGVRLTRNIFLWLMESIEKSFFLNKKVGGKKQFNPLNDYPLGYFRGGQNSFRNFPYSPFPPSKEVNQKELIYKGELWKYHPEEYFLRNKHTDEWPDFIAALIKGYYEVRSKYVPLKLGYLHDTESLENSLSSREEGFRRNLTLAKFFYNIARNISSLSDLGKADACCRLAIIYFSEAYKEFLFASRAFELLQSTQNLSKNGNQHYEAFLKLGQCYEEGIGTVIDQKKALEIYEAYFIDNNCFLSRFPNFSIDFLRAFNTYLLGKVYEKGLQSRIYGRIQNPQDALYCYLATYNYYPQASYKLGTLEEEKNKTNKAAEYYEIAAQPIIKRPYCLSLHPDSLLETVPASSEAIYRLAKLTKTGKLCKGSDNHQRDSLMATNLFLQAAEMQYPPALHELAKFYSSSWHLNIIDDKKISNYLYKISSQKRFAKSQYERAKLLQKKNQNSNEAFALYLEASNQGHTLATYKVAKAYLFGRGVPQDLNKAYEYFQKAYAKKHIKSTYYLGQFHEKGWSPVRGKNLETAASFYWKAYQGNNIKSTFLIGLFVEEGIVYKRDLSLSIECYNQASLADYHEAIYRIGFLYEKGEILNINLDKAKQFYIKAGLMGNLNALEGLKRLGYDENTLRENISETELKDPTSSPRESIISLEKTKDDISEEQKEKQAKSTCHIS